jgi:hypothetical protein
LARRFINDTIRSRNSQSRSGSCIFHVSLFFDGRSDVERCFRPGDWEGCPKSCVLQNGSRSAIAQSFMSVSQHQHTSRYLTVCRWMADVILGVLLANLALFLTAVQIYRCFLIWNREKWVLVLPMLLLLASVASKCWTHRRCLAGMCSHLTAQIPPVILQYIVDTSPESTGSGTKKALNQLSRVSPTLFPFLITVAVTTMSGLLSSRFWLAVGLILFITSLAYMAGQS